MGEFYHCDAKRQLMAYRAIVDVRSDRSMQQYPAPHSHSIMATVCPSHAVGIWSGSRLQAAESACLETRQSTALCYGEGSINTMDEEIAFWIILTTLGVLNALGGQLIGSWVKELPLFWQVLAANCLTDDPTAWRPSAATQTIHHMQDSGYMWNVQLLTRNLAIIVLWLHAFPLPAFMLGWSCATGWVVGWHASMRSALRPSTSDSFTPTILETNNDENINHHNGGLASAFSACLWRPLSSSKSTRGTLTAFRKNDQKRVVS